MQQLNVPGAWRYPLAESFLQLTCNHVLSLEQNEVLHCNALAQQRYKVSPTPLQSSGAVAWRAQGCCTARFESQLHSLVRRHEPVAATPSARARNPGIASGKRFICRHACSSKI